MLAAAAGDAKKLRAFTHEEAVLVRDQTGPAGRVAARAWEYYAMVAERKPLGG